MTKSFKIAVFVLLAVFVLGTAALQAQDQPGVTRRVFDNTIGRSATSPGQPVTIFASLVAPAVGTMTPTTGARGTTVSMSFAGTDFESGMTIDAGDGITTTNTVLTGTTTLTTNFVISSTASLGQHNVTLTSSGGISNPKGFFVVPATPTLTSITPATVAQGATVNISLTGTNFIAGMTLNAGISGDFSTKNMSVLSATTATATLVITSTASTGARELFVTTSGGVSNGYAITIVAPPVPTITGISPTTGVKSSSVPVTLTGTNFISGLTFEAMDGITVSNVIVNDSTSVTATFAVASDAALGARAVKVTTSGGTSTAASFSVVNALPTLSSLSPNDGGQTGTALVTVSGTNFATGMSIDPEDSGIIVTNITVLSSIKATASFTIAGDARLGPHNVTVTTEAGTSNGLPFTVKVPPPTLSVIDPASAILGTAVLVNITGTNLYAPMTISLGTGITVSDLAVVDTSTATAKITVGVNAAPGLQTVTLTTPGGTSTANLFTVIPFAPTFTSMTPNTSTQANLARSFTVTLTGTNFYEPTIAISGTGVTTPADIFVTSPTSGTAVFTVDANVALGARNVTITNAGGTSAALPFTIVAASPTLTSVTPATGVRGTSVPVTLIGSNLDGTTALSTMAGVTVSNLTVVNSLTVTATLAIDANAALGTRSLTATTALGVTNALTFTIADPFPDLSITSSHTGKFGVGFNETYTVTVSNVGTKASSGTTTVTDTLPPGLTFVSASGTGWTCGATGQTVSCSNSTALAAAASSSYTLTVAVGSTAAANVNHTVSLGTPTGDLNSANNSYTDPTIVAPTPSPAFQFSALTPGEQGSLIVKIGSTFPHDITGTIAMEFVPNAIIPIDDKAIAFASGGRTATYTIAANSTLAKYGTATTTDPLGFQVGTVSGKLNFSGTFTAGTAQGTFAPTIDVSSPVVQQVAPVIKSIETTTSGGFAANILLFSTIREVTEISMRFDTTPRVKPSCGNVVGCSITGDQEVTFNVASLFNAWYTADKTYGSLALLRIPLSISGGSTKGRVQVILKSRLGYSNVSEFKLP